MCDSLTQKEKERSLRIFSAILVSLSKRSDYVSCIPGNMKLALQCLIRRKLLHSVQKGDD